MRVARPEVSAREELEHRLRNVSLKRQQELEAIARDPNADVSKLTEFDRGLVKCMRESDDEMQER